jgi:hypothetical protein
MTWTVVTAAAVLTAWFAVSSAVANVSDPAPAVIGARRAAGDTPSAAATAPAADSSSAPSSVGDPTPTTITGSESTASSAAPSTAGGGTGVGDPLEIDNADPTPPTSAAVTNTASFANEGGVVTLSCTGTAVSLVSATPRQGYTVSVGNSGPSEVEVAFKSTSHDAEIHGRCSGGVPVATVSDD